MFSFLDMVNHYLGYFNINVTLKAASTPFWASLATFICSTSVFDFCRTQC